MDIEFPVMLLPGFQYKRNPMAGHVLLARFHWEKNPMTGHGISGNTTSWISLGNKYHE